jgi:hypothetical protein
VARGATKGERRRGRRRGVQQPANDSWTVLDSDDDPVATLPERMEQQPGWVRRIWATPGNRLTLSGAVVVGATYVLYRGLTDPDVFDTRRFACLFALAPVMLGLFFPQAVEAITDLRHGRNTWPPVFHRMGARMDRRAGLWVVLLLVWIVAGTWLAVALFAP